MTMSTAKLAAWQFKEIDPPGGVRFELVDGEIVVSPSPNLHHAQVIAELFVLLKLHVDRHDLGQVYLDTDTEFGPHDVRRPDILFFRKERLARLDPNHPRELPDLAVEVISPGSERTDRQAKFEQYAMGGIACYWIIDPRQRTFEAYTLSGGKYTLATRGTGTETVRAEPFGGLEIPLAKLWWK